MARLHVLGPWHGPGEEKTARRLEAELPADWDVVAGRNVPDGIGTVDLDLVVVGRHAVFVVEEKAWGRHVVTGEVSWFVNGEARHSPANQVSHAARVLAGRVRTRVAGWKQAARGSRPVTGHVVLSHDHLQLDDAADLGDRFVIPLAAAAGVLTTLDAAFPADLAPLRPALMAFLLGLAPRGPEPMPAQIYQYTVVDRPTRNGDTLVYIARTPAGEPAFLTCVPIANAADPQEAERVAVRDHDALAALAAEERAFVLRKVYREMFRWGQTGRLRLAVVLDEAHRLARDVTLPKIMKEGRKYGVAVVVASQGVTDFHKDVLGNAGTKVAFRCNYPQSRTVAGFLRGRAGQDMAQVLENLAVGQAYVSTPDHAVARRVHMARA